MSSRKKVSRENIFDTDLTRPSRESEPKPIDAEDEELDTVFSQFPQHDACIELFRTTEKGGKPAFLEDISPAEFTFGYVCQTYGGGRYIAKGKYKDGSMVKRNFDIEGSSFPVRRKVPEGAPGPSIAPIPIPQPERIEVLRDERGQPDALATVVSMMKTLVVELRSSEDQVLDKMMKYKALFGSVEKPQTPVAEAISMIKTGIELGSTAGNDGGIPWLMIVDKLQAPLTELASAFTRGITRQNPGLTPPSPSPTRIPEPSAPVGEPATMETILVGALKGMLPMLVTGAALKADPGFYSDLLLDQIPRQFYATAKIWLEKPDCLDVLIQMNAAVANDRLWFESLRSELTGALAAELGHASGTIQPEPAADSATGSTTDL